jgi:Na(+)-translocating NADH:ubiquinone oxidoreductase A subunit
MKTKGGYNILLEGKPAKEILTLREPTTLYLPLTSKRFSFSELFVRESQRVLQGMVLASDPRNHGIPLLAPRSGVASLAKAPGHVTIENVLPDAGKQEFAYPEAYEIPASLGHREKTIRQLIRKGAWQYFTDAFSGNVPAPSDIPQAVIVSTVNLEPFSVRGDAQLESRLPSFLSGLEQLQPLIEYQPIYLVFPVSRSTLGRKIREIARGMAWIRLHEIPLRYPFDHPRILARRLGLRPADGVVWTLRTEGILAIDNAATYSLAASQRIMAIGGCAAGKRSHFSAMPGYPLALLKEQMEVREPARLINGGALTGTAFAADSLGIDAEGHGFTALSTVVKRTLAAYLRPGWGEHSFSPSFLSALRPPFAERMSTAQRGELRPCISCGFCVEVCPASIYPSVIHKRLYAKDLDAVEKARPDCCIGCGLCSFVCTSKIDLRQEILEANETLRRESAAPEEGARA